MLKEERQQAILERLKQQSQVLTMPLSQELAVSEDTIRRDLKELAEQGVLKKVHGGAVATNSNPLHFHDREVYALAEKQALARLAVQQLRPEQILMMDGGSTNLELARLIPADIPLTIFTNSLPIAAELADRPRLRLQLIGGQLLPSARVTIGPEAIQMIQQTRVDLCILGTRSLDAELGITEIDWDETLVKRAMLQAAREVMCLVIAEKIGTTQPYVIGSPTEISTLVTTLPKSDARMEALRRQGIDFLLPT